MIELLVLLLLLLFLCLVFFRAILSVLLWLLATLLFPFKYVLGAGARNRKRHEERLRREILENEAARSRIELERAKRLSGS